MQTQIKTCSVDGTQTVTICAGGWEVPVKPGVICAIRELLKVKDAGGHHLNRILSIKLLLDATSHHGILGLKEAKDFVDLMIDVGDGYARKYTVEPEALDRILRA